MLDKNQHSACDNDKLLILGKILHGIYLTILMKFKLFKKVKHAFRIHACKLEN